jgi:arylsulfatase A-like enzyme
MKGEKVPTRRYFLKSLALGTAYLLVPESLKAGTTRGKLNFIFILVDDLGWKDLGCYAGTFYDTPNINRLASEGMRFSNAYAACPVCSPTRASIMAGKYPARMDTTDWFGAPQPETVQDHWTKNKPLLPASYIDRLPLQEVTLAEALVEHGYETFFAGKWHLGDKGFFPEDQGFKLNKGGHHRGWPPGGYFSPYNNPELTDGPEGEHLPDRLATETIRFIENNRDKPFLAYLSFYSVHTPLQSREDLKIKYEQKAENLKHTGPAWGAEGASKVRLVQDHPVYAGMVEAMDQAVGKVLGKLKALALEKSTAVIFMSDNGGLSTAEGHPTSNLPLRAGKGWLYEGGIREPMVIKWPGVTRPGSVCNEPVISTDFYPTMMEMAELTLRNQQHIDGVSLVPLLKRTGKPQRKALYWHYPHYGNQGSSPSAAVRAGDWKLIEFFEDNHVELYNLKTDIGEKNDLSESMPDKVRRLREMLHAWQKEVGARFPRPNPACKKEE